MTKLLFGLLTPDLSSKLDSLLLMTVLFGWKKMSFLVLSIIYKSKNTELHGSILGTVLTQ
jgi:ABC-type microcin C transport system permease subunit YejE